MNENSIKTDNTYGIKNSSDLVNKIKRLKMLNISKRLISRPCLIT